LPYPPLRYFQSGATATSPARLLQQTAITPLTSCLIPGVHFATPPPFPSPPRKTRAPLTAPGRS